MYCFGITKAGNFRVATLVLVVMHNRLSRYAVGWWILFSINRTLNLGMWLLKSFFSTNNYWEVQMVILFNSLLPVIWEVYLYAFVYEEQSNEMMWFNVRGDMFIHDFTMLFFHHCYSFLWPDYLMFLQMVALYCIGIMYLSPACTFFLATI